MIKKEDWEEWIGGLLEYGKKYYPEINVNEKKVIDIAFKSLRTVYMEQIIIDIGEER